MEVSQCKQNRFTILSGHICSTGVLFDLAIQLKYDLFKYLWKSMHFSTMKTWANYTKQPIPWILILSWRKMEPSPWAFFSHDATQRWIAVSLQAGYIDKFQWWGISGFTDNTTHTVELSPRAFPCLCCSLVHLHLEYLSTACRPYLERDFKQLERLHSTVFIDHWSVHT